MALLSSVTRIKYLRDLGFLGSEKTMITNFQRGWNLGAWLTVDGLYGPKTDSALRTSADRMRRNLSTCSLNFSFREFKCKCNGQYRNCQGVWISRAHVKRMQDLRSKIGPVTVNSGCRCVDHNRAVGGALSSQHMFGVASDIAPTTTTARMKSFNLFAGIGYSQSSGRVLHVDSRDIGGHNSTGGKTSAPTVWRYA